MHHGTGWRVGLCVGVLLSGWGVAWALEPSSRTSNMHVAVTASPLDMSEELAGASDSGPMRISMEFENANLKDVLKTFSQQTGINVIASEDVGNRTITLYLEDVTVMDALDQILEAAQLVYTRPAKSQIYVVKSKPAGEMKPETLTKIYPLKYARVSSSRLAKSVEAFGAITPFEAQQLTQLTSGGGATGGGATGGGGGGTSGGGTGSASTKRDVGLDKVVEELLTDQGKVAVDERTNSLIVTDLPENFPRLDAAIRVLDARTPQLLIETELLETTLSRIKDLGVKWGTGSTGTQFSFTPAQKDTLFPFIFGEGKQNVIAGVSGNTNFTKVGQIALGTLDASQAAATLQALEKDTDTTILARPKILTLANESAVIRLTSNQAIGFETSSGETSGVTTATPERATTGVILVVTPQVNEHGFVTMLVEPSVTKVVSSLINPPTKVGGTVVDPKTRSARALVRIRQGETLVLGGLIDRSEEEVHQRVPLLSSIPLLGEAFKNKDINRSTSELIVFVTPRILSEPDTTQMASAAGAAAAPAAGLNGAQGRTPTRQELMERTLDNVLQQRGGTNGT